MIREDILVPLTLITAIFIVMFVLFGRPAHGGEMMECEYTPVTGDGRQWSYRTNVGGKPDKCWYPGPSMKPRSELRWPDPPSPASEAERSEDTSAPLVSSPVPAPTKVEEPVSLEEALKTRAIELAAVYAQSAPEPILETPPIRPPEMEKTPSWFLYAALFYGVAMFCLGIFFTIWPRHIKNGASP